MNKNHLFFWLLLTLVFHGIVSAQRQWEPAGYGASGNFTGVYFDPTQAGVVYITSDVTGVFRSTDYGETWEVRCSGLGNYQVASFAIDPFDSNTLYAGVGTYSGLSDRNGIYVSHDAGHTWQQLASTVADTIIFKQNRTVQSIAPDPYRPGVIISGSWFKGIWRSTDSGNSWTQVFVAPVVPPIQAEYIQTNSDDVSPFRAPVTVILFHPTDSNVAYAGLDGYGILKSLDAGITWNTINTGLPDTVWVKHLSISSDGNVLHAALAENGVYKSIDGGNTWQHITSTLPTSTHDWISAVAAHPTNTDTVFFTLASPDSPVIWKTVDGGNNWSFGSVINDTVNCPTETWHTKIFPFGAHYAWHIAMDPFDSDRLFFVDLWSVFRSTDGGMTWQEKVKGAQNTGVDKIFTDTNHPDGDPDTLWATHMDAGLLRSFDKGNTWEAILPSSANTLSELDSLAGHYWDFAIGIDQGVKYHYAGATPWNESKSRIFRSTNGINWETVFAVPRDTDLALPIQRKSPRAIAVDPSQPSTVYAAFDSDSIYKSTSNGNNGSWTATTSQPGNIYSRYYCSMAVNDYGWVFVSSEYGGIWRSKDGGDSWQTLITQQDDSLSYQVLVANGKLYATGYDKFGNPSQHYSTDWGDTWQEFNNLYPSNSVEHAGRAVAVDPADSNHIVYALFDRAYDGANRLGIYESFDNGSTWDYMNDGLRNLNITSITFGKDGTLYAGTNGNGIWSVNPTLSADEETAFVPLGWRLQQNYPNPFNPETTIRYQLPEADRVSLRIYNLLGEEVRALVNEKQIAGNYLVSWDGSNDAGMLVSSGVYFYKLKVGKSFVATRKMVLLR